MSAPANASTREPPKAPTLGEGADLGRYHLLRKLGEGGMGVVYLAEHRGLGRNVAVKVLRSGAAHTEVQATRFQREAELVSSIGHPNIVEVYDFGRTTDGSLYYVMELLNGESLRSRLRRSPLSDREIAELFVPLLSAVGAAHQLGIVHRDLKPDNVMLVGDGEGGMHVKLLDFGVAKNLGQPGAGMTTVSGAMLGTPAYMSPEQIKHSAHVDGRTDIYSVGVMLYEALAGQRPFSGGPIEVLSKHLYEDLVLPSVVAQQKTISRPGIIWGEMDQILVRVLAKEAEARYPNVAEFLEALQKAWPTVAPQDPAERTATASAASSGISLPEDDRAVAARWGPKRLGIAVVLALLAAGIAGGVWFLRTPKNKPAAHLVATSAKNPVPQWTDEERAKKRIAAALVGDTEERRALAVAIGEVGGTTSQHEIRVLLGDAEPVVAKAALQAVFLLGPVADSQTLEALQTLGDKTGGAVGVGAMAARLQLGDVRVQTTLAAAARGAALDGETRIRALVALAQKGALKAPELRSAVLRTVEQGGLRPSVYLVALRELIRLHDPETIKRLHRAVTDPNPHLRLEAAEALALAGLRAGKDALYKLAVASPDDLSLAVLLATSGDPRALPLLQAKLSASSALLRQKAVVGIGALATHGGKACDLRLLSPALTDSDRVANLNAAVAFLAVRHCEKKQAALSK